MGRVTQRRKVHKYVLDGSPKALEFPVRHREDVLAVEEPLEIRLGQLSFSVTMRTPGDDFDLVAGFLVSEGIIWSSGQLVSLRFCAGEDEDGVQTFNVVEVQLRPDVTVPSIGQGIPVIDLIHVPFPNTWHTTQDTPENVSPASLGQVGRVLVELLWGEVAP